MSSFSIDHENTITAFPAAQPVPEGHHRFATEKDLARLSAEWPINRFVEIWNSFAGAVPFDELKPVKKFTDRKAAVARIWKAIQRLDAAPAPQAAPSAPKKTKEATRAKAGGAAPTAREGSKKAIVIAMLKRPDGATLDSIVATTGWQRKTVYGFISGAICKKLGLTVDSIRSNEGVRSYRIAK